jgi:hypothetical protein
MPRSGRPTRSGPVRQDRIRVVGQFGPKVPNNQKSRSSVYERKEGWVRPQQLCDKVSMLKLSFLSLRTLMLLLVGTSVAVAQTGSSDISPALRQRVEVMLRSKADFPPATTIGFSKRGPSDVPGFDKLDAHFSSAITGESGNLSLLISKDGTRVAQFTSYDIADDPRMKVPAKERPSQGGPADAFETVTKHYARTQLIAQNRLSVVL